MRYLITALCIFFLFSIPAVWAQSSPNYELSEHTFNSGGNPEDGIILNSTNYQITLDAIGDAVVGTGLTSPSYQHDGGFPSWYPPPREVFNLHFLDKTTLGWDPESSVGDYNIYRGLISTLSSGYDGCLQGNNPGEIFVDSSTYSGEAYFYVITAENRIDEEGTLGFTSTGTERTNTNPCP